MPSRPPALSPQTPIDVTGAVAVLALALSIVAGAATMLALITTLLLAAGLLPGGHA